MNAFETLSSLPGSHLMPSWFSDYNHRPGFFGIFDGHCGSEAARYSAEQLTQYVYNELSAEVSVPSGLPLEENLGEVLLSAIAKLDDKFCQLCSEDGRNWESGTTAIISAIVDDRLIIANIGDCRAVLCRSVESTSDKRREEILREQGWTQADHDSESDDRWGRPEYFWQEVADVHSPSRPDERARIELANGWITTEKEIPIAQMQRMDFCDEDVVEILQRCFSDRYEQPQTKKCNAAPQRILQISRVCGELAVSRAIGDRDFKAAFNSSTETTANSEGEPSWDCPLFLPYPDSHSRKFKGDLISAIPEIRSVRVSPNGYVDEFLLLACDGLWDVMDPDDAVRVTRGLLLGKKWPAKKAAARLAELAIHLGSSDNITVIVISFKKQLT